MKALLVRVGADQSEWGGWWNGPVDSATGEFVYVPIPDDGPFHPGLATPYSVVAARVGERWPSLPPRLALRDMHLDPDFSDLTCGDQGQRAVQVMGKVGSGDLLVYYAGLRDVHSAGSGLRRARLDYALRHGATFATLRRTRPDLPQSRPLAALRDPTVAGRPRLVSGEFYWATKPA